MSAVLRVGLKPAWEGDRNRFTLFLILLRVIRLTTFLMTGSRTMGLRLEGGPWGFPGLGRRMRLPFPMLMVSSDVNMVFRASVRSCMIQLGAALRSSACILSGPIALLLFNRLIAVLISAGVMGLERVPLNIGSGSNGLIGLELVPVYFSLKYACRILSCSLLSSIVWPS